MSNPNSSSTNTGTSPMEIIQDTTATQPLNQYGMDGTVPVGESWGSWIQSNDDIEIRMMVPITTTSKQCQIQFRKNSIKVVVHNQTILEGTTYDPIDVDDCTYTLQDIKNQSSTIYFTMYIHVRPVSTLPIVIHNSRCCCSFDTDVSLLELLLVLL